MAEKFRKSQNITYLHENNKAINDMDRDVNSVYTKRVQVNKRYKIFSVRGGLDAPFLIFVLLLVAIGLIMMFSASYPIAYYTSGDSYMYLSSQAMFAVLGIVAMIAISYFDYHHFHKLSVILLAVSMILLILVLVIPSAGDVKRWINLGITSFQPSELAKFAVILFLAHWNSQHFKDMDKFTVGVLPAIGVYVPMAVLLFLEPHYSCIVIITLLVAVMLFLGGVRLRWFAIVGGILAVAIVVVVLTGASDYLFERLDGWTTALEYINEDQWQDTWQTRNSLYAIGSGGFTGLGLGQSRQKYLYLPEPQNDFVFAIVCEELGFIGAAIILGIFGLLVWRGITVSMRAKDKFGTILGVGITAQIGLQVILNILVITDWLPNTGISLPFFSYGGTSICMLLAQMGIVLSISRTSRIEKL